MPARKAGQAGAVPATPLPPRPPACRRRGLLSILAVPLLLAAAPAFADTALLVVGDADPDTDGLQLTAGDATISGRLASQFGFDVQTVSDATALSSDALGKRIVLLSGSAFTSSATDDLNLGLQFRGVATPVLSLNAETFPQLAFTGDLEFTDFGLVASGTELSILDPSSPLAAGLSGTVSVYTSDGGINFAKPGGDAQAIASLSGSPDAVAIFGYEKGAALAGDQGFTAAARRVGFFAPDTDFFGDGEFTRLTPAGEALFDAAVRYAVAEPATVIPEPASATVLSLAGGLLLFRRRRA